MYPHMMGEIRVQQSGQPRRKKHEADSFPSKVQALKQVPEIKTQKKPGYARSPIFMLAGLKDDYETVAHSLCEITVSDLTCMYLIKAV